MDKIIIWAPLTFGAMIGWLSVFFIRKYKKYDSKILWKTAGVFLAGVGLDSLGFIISSESGVICILYYMLGCSIGFFAHWIYQFIISIISREGRKSITDYSLLSSCNLSEEEELKLMEEMAQKNTINLSESSSVGISKEDNNTNKINNMNKIAVVKNGSDNIFWRIITALSLILSIFAICRLFYRTDDLGFDYLGIIVGSLAIMVTCLVGWNIHTAIDANHKIKEMRDEIATLRSSIVSDKLSSERRINKLKAELYDNIVSINRHILGFEKSTVSTHLLINMISSIDYLSRSEEFAVAESQIELYYAMTKDDLALIKKDLDKESHVGLYRLLYEMPNKEEIKNFSKLEELIKLACS